ncbi:hypothetical protein B0H12DRAFT_1098962 [Mycena haematopus]|nr:hypothetical protein B0H12DRAFT_1098962 [Mycena haematopus]
MSEPITRLRSATSVFKRLRNSACTKVMVSETWATVSSSSLSFAAFSQSVVLGGCHACTELFCPQFMKRRST